MSSPFAVDPGTLTEARELLKGSAVTEEVVQQVGELARKAAHPVANTTSTT